MNRTRTSHGRRASSPCLPVVLGAVCLLIPVLTSIDTVQAAELESGNAPSQNEDSLSVLDGQEADYGGWSLNIDNDLFSGGDLDRDYTGGVAIAVTGARTREWPVSLDKTRAALARLSRFDRLYSDTAVLSRHSIEFGFTLFTPNDITVAEPIKDDHPYASLFFIASAAQHVVPERKLSYQTVLTVGALGLPLADTVQSGIHRAIGSEQPQGWDNQISHGGEPTARYSVGLQKTLIEGGGPGLSTQFSVNSEATVGFTTDASVGFGIRWGRLERPWYTFNPHPAEYISVGTPPEASDRTTGRREIYLYAGANIKYRLYNAILQGQFRDSRVSFDHDQLNPVILEGWAGFLAEVAANYRLGMFLRARTAELDKAESRNPVWGGILISRSL
ncbi:lipid A deacylase LpxR family protein [Granulosicoccus sp. 3-233]|uniref:lipid A deacylase LpxR family protein n=1 Tax=Granulosicoccus sp. 3-233 TaxID=3417969 RepID=UPI003D3589EA